jgi:hypothetical protein
MTDLLMGRPCGGAIDLHDHGGSAGAVHDLVNPAPTPALSVHVYAPRLTHMTYYDHRPSGFLRPLRTQALAVGQAVGR